MIGAGRSFVLFLRNWPADQEGRVTRKNDLAGDVESDRHQKDSPRNQQSAQQKVRAKFWNEFVIRNRVLWFAGESKNIHLSMLKLKMTLGGGIERAQPFPTLLMSARQP